MAHRPTPGVVANSLIRYLLTQAGLAAGGYTDQHRQQTLAYFDNKCAFTGQSLASQRLEEDHAVPLNRTHGGLHIYGNVLPATAEANREKGGLRYDEFLRSKGERFKSVAHLSDAEREAAITHIEQFRQQARPDSLLSADHPELRTLYAAQYEQAKQLCADSLDQVVALLAKLSVVEDPASETVEATQNLPSDEQLALEEQDEAPLPEPYQAIRERGSQTGIGAYARAVFEQLFADGRIAALLPNLTYREDSFYQLGLSFPALATERTGDQAKRYYAKPLRYEGTEYYLCSQWYERQRDRLDSWLAEQASKNPVRPA